MMSVEKKGRCRLEEEILRLLGKNLEDIDKNLAYIQELLQEKDISKRLFEKFPGL